VLPNSRRWLVAVAVATAAVGLTACGDGGQQQTPAAASTTTAPMTTTAPVTGAPGTSSADVVPTGTPVDTEPPTSVAVDPTVSREAGQVSVTLTRARWDAGTSSVRAAGFVGGVVESDGSCTLTLSRGSDERTAEAPGAADATTTTCAGLAVPGDQLSAGTWTAVLSYRSADSSGSSQPLTVTVP
jgi:hypothetical protein